MSKRSVSILLLCISILCISFPYNAYGAVVGATEIQLYNNLSAYKPPGVGIALIGTYAPGEGMGIESIRTSYITGSDETSFSIVALPSGTTVGSWQSNFAYGEIYYQAMCPAGTTSINAYVGGTTNQNRGINVSLWVRVGPDVASEATVQDTKIAAEAARVAAINVEAAVNYIKNNILSISGGIIQDSSGTVLQVARNTLTVTNTVNATLGTVNTNVSTVKTDVGTVKMDISSVKTTVGTVNTTVGTINTNVNTANTTLGTVNTNVNTVKNDVSSVKTTVGSVNTTLGTVNTNVGTVKTDVGTVKNNVWDSTEGKSAATLAKEARDKVNDLKSLITPTILEIKGLNDATCTSGPVFTVVISASGANQYCARIAMGSWSSWDSSNIVTVPIGISAGPKTIEIKARNSVNPAAEAIAFLTIYKL